MSFINDEDDKIVGDRVVTCMELYRGSHCLTLASTGNIGKAFHNIKTTHFYLMR